MILPASAGSDGNLTLRTWRGDDAVPLAEALAASRDHLAPWMEWAHGPVLTPAEHAARFAAWERRRLDAGEAMYGIFLDGVVVGACGLHDRLAPGGLEIGYWVHVAHLRRGIATRAAGRLTDTAFEQPGIERVEIHHDAANVASGGIPRRLGFTALSEHPRARSAPGDSGIERRWRVTRADWLRARQDPTLRP